MPFKLVPPQAGRSSFWRIRGSHCGITLDRSTKLTDKAKAAKLLAKWRDEAERGLLAKPGEPTFLSAAVAYIKAGGESRFVGSRDDETGEWSGLIAHFGEKPLSQISQQAIDEAAVALYPNAAPATRNRQVHTVVSSILKHAGIDSKLKRPKGWRGKKRTDWLKPEQAFRIFAAARGIDPEFEAFLIFLCYTGCRLSEALRLKVDQVEISEAFAYLAQTKNEDPRGVFLPPVVISALANHPRGLDRKGEKVFRFTKCGRLYNLLQEVKDAAGADVGFATFHTFCHTWATWMRRYGGLDIKVLVATGRWRDEQSASRYQHVVVAEESRKALMLPVERKRKKRT